MALRLAARQARLVVFGYNAVTSKIEWVRSPDSPQYAGSPLSLNGGQVMAYYKDGTASDITGSCVYNPDAGTLLEYGGELNINATYTDHAGNEFTADTKIDVADVEELLFTGLANPTQKEGAALDLSGAQLSARYSDGTVRTVDASSAVFSPAAGSIIGHTDTLSIQATWQNPATGSESGRLSGALRQRRVGPGGAAAGGRKGGVKSRKTVRVGAERSDSFVQPRRLFLPDRQAERWGN